MTPALPYGVFRTNDGPARVGVAVGEHVLDLAPALDDAVFAAPSLDPFLAQGPERWRATRARLLDLLASARPPAQVARHLLPAAATFPTLPFTVADYVDFYASEHHATNAGRIFRPGGEPLTPNWRHLPVGYHGRAGTVVVSGTPVVRPSGPLGPGRFGPSAKLDFEAEVGFVVGVPAAGPVGAEAFDAHVFGVVLVNDWSARDIQRWEGQPLGPFLGKSFATSVSAWVVPLDALAGDRLPAPAQDPAPLPYLRDPCGTALDLTLEVAVNGRVVSRPPFSSMYWTPGQLLAQMTANGASLRTGDLFASGTVSGPDRSTWGSLLELSWDAAYLADGDTVTITASTPSGVQLGPVVGTVLPAVTDHGP